MLLISLSMATDFSWSSDTFDTNDVVSSVIFCIFCSNASDNDFTAVSIAVSMMAFTSSRVTLFGVSSGFSFGLSPGMSSQPSGAFPSSGAGVSPAGASSPVGVGSVLTGGVPESSCHSPDGVSIGGVSFCSSSSHSPYSFGAHLRFNDLRRFVSSAKNALATWNRAYGFAGVATIDISARSSSVMTRIASCE